MSAQPTFQPKHSPNPKEHKKRLPKMNTFFNIEDPAHLMKTERPMWQRKQRLLMATLPYCRK